MSFLRYGKYVLSCPKLYGTFVPGDIYNPPPIEGLVDIVFLVMPFLLVYSFYEWNPSYVLMCLGIFLCIRAIRNLWRLSNFTYRQFLGVLEAAENNPNLMHALREYDFDFNYFPVTYRCEVSVHNFANRQERGLLYYLTYPMAHSIGIVALYPGILTGRFLTQRLVEGRRKLVMEHGGVREKIKAQSDVGDTVEIDTIYIDRRNGRRRSMADILIILCEGNAGFYEIGMMEGALVEGYSILGWNHPGFGGSSGTPHPTSELTAALAVMDFAVTVLNFDLSTIMVYGWSIGGFPASYLASRFLNIRGLILDATFDHILPVALTYVPGLLAPLVNFIVVKHFNLDNLENLRNYSGRIRIVRRVTDEVMAVQPGNLRNNRTSKLLIWFVLNVSGIISTRLDKEIFSDWVEIPHHDDLILSDCLLGGIVPVGSRERASSGLIRIARSILRDYDSGHNSRLPARFFRIRRGG